MDLNAGLWKSAKVTHMGDGDSRTTATELRLQLWARVHGIQISAASPGWHLRDGAAVLTMQSHSPVTVSPSANPALKLRPVTRLSGTARDPCGLSAASGRPQQQLPRYGRGRELPLGALYLGTGIR